MNLPITVNDDVRDDIACCVKDWLNGAAVWSQKKYDFLDLEKDVVISVEKQPEDVPGEWATFKPQKTPYEIRLADSIEHVSWKVESMERYHLKSGYFYTGPQIAYEAGIIQLLSIVAFTLGPEDYRKSWDRLESPQADQYDYLRETYPDLLDSWWDQNKYVESIKVKPSKEHWRFPAPNPKLCRISGCGQNTGMWYPEGSGRS